MKTIISREAKAALDDVIKNAVKNCGNTISIDEFERRCEASDEIEISEDADIVIVEEV